MTEPRLATYARLRQGRLFHIMRASTPEVWCGTSGEIVEHQLADSRAVRVAGLPVCGNCRDQLDKQLRKEYGSTPIDEAGAAAPADKETSMAKTSELDKLAAERTSVNNRLSGIRTQTARVTQRLKNARRRKDAGTIKVEQEKLAALERRREKELKLRDQLGTKIDKLRGNGKGKGRSSTPPPPAPAPPPVPDPSPDTPATAMHREAVKRTRGTSTKRTSTSRKRTTAARR